MSPDTIYQLSADGRDDNAQRLAMRIKASLDGGLSLDRVAHMLIEAWRDEQHSDDPPDEVHLAEIVMLLLIAWDEHRREANSAEA